MPLILPEQPPEHPDVTALKNTVREVAKRYAKEYNLCSVVDRALREAGINGPNAKVEVAIRFSVAGSDEQTAHKTFDVNSLVGKTHEEQVAWIAEQIAPKVDVAGVQVTLPVTVLDIDGEYEEPASPVANGQITINGFTYPEGHIHAFTSSEGRVAHLLRHDWDPNSQPLVDALNEVRTSRRYGNLRALCGTDLYSPTTFSTRSEGRICFRCVERTAARS